MCKTKSRINSKFHTKVTLKGNNSFRKKCTNSECRLSSKVGPSQDVMSRLLTSLARSLPIPVFGPTRRPDRPFSGKPFISVI